MFTLSFASFSRREVFGMKNFCIPGINVVINTHGCKMRQKELSAGRGQLPYAHKRQILPLMKERH